jgi:glycerol-3-phosphate dehydrogenase
MGEDTVEYWSKITGLTLAPSRSKDILLHGFAKSIPEGHWSVYGSDAVLIQDLAKNDQHLSEKIHPDFPNILAEVVWAVRNEMAVKVEDVLSRRIRMLILDAQAAMDSAEKVAKLMALELAKDAAWIEKELADFRTVAEKYVIKI